MKVLCSKPDMLNTISVLSDRLCVFLCYLFIIVNLLVMDPLAKKFLFQVNKKEKLSKLNLKLKRIAINHHDKIDKDISSYSFHTSALQDSRITRINEVIMALYAGIKLELLVKSKADLNNTAFCYRDVLCNK